MHRYKSGHSIADLGCQLDPKQLGVPVKNFLNWIILGGKIQPKSGPHLLVAAHRK